MISLAASWGITLRHLRLYKHDLNMFLFMICWPFLDIIVWGFLGSWIQQTGTSQFHNYKMIALLGVLLWQIAGRGANAISFALCEELWQNNIINIFSLPLSIIEWICGTLIYYTLMGIAFGICSFAFVWGLYTVDIGNLFLHYLLFSIPLFFSGIWLGFMCLQIILLLGKRGIELGFVAIWFLLPFSGAYYPIEILPQWAQTLSYFFPLSYTFTAMRNYLMRGENPLLFLCIGTILSIGYAALSIAVFIFLFNRSKKRGLVRLMD